MSNMANRSQLLFADMEQLLSIHAFCLWKESTHIGYKCFICIKYSEVIN